MKKTGIKPTKVGVIFIVAVMSFAAIGASYAHWQEILTIEGVMTTDDIHPMFAKIVSNDDLNKMDPTSCGEWGYDKDNDDWNWGGSRRDKNVGNTDVTTTDDDQTLNIIINDAYPCYFSHVAYMIRNTGSCPVLTHRELMLEELSIQTDPDDLTTHHVINIQDRMLNLYTEYYVDIYQNANLVWKAKIVEGPVDKPEKYDFMLEPTGSNLVHQLNVQLDPYSWKDNPGEHMETPGDYLGQIPGDLCIHFENGCMQNVKYDFKFGMTFWNWPEFCVPEKPPVRYPETGNAYIGYEDWYDGDFDYNDFGMTFYLEEYYNPDDELTQVTMSFTAIVFDSGMRHLIHIKRPFNGGYSYTVTRSTPAYPNVLTLWDGTTGQETTAGAYTGTGDLDVTLFNTAKYSWPQKHIDETVTITVVLDDPSLNPKTILMPPREYNVGSGDFYDLDPIMAYYDPWEEGTLYQCRFHIDDTQVITNTASQKYYPAGEVIPVDTETPFILVVPYTDWIPPYEDSTITGPYGNFNDFYTTGSPANWYETITNPTVGYGGLSWS